MGKQLTRISIGKVFTGMRSLPSWGKRFSEISMRDSTLIREMMRSFNCARGGGRSCRWPSIRTLTLSTFSKGSKWISDAPSASAVTKKCVSQSTACWSWSVAEEGYDSETMGSTVKKRIHKGVSCTQKMKQRRPESGNWAACYLRLLCKRLTFISAESVEA